MRKLPINIQIVFNTQDDEYDELMKDCKEFAKGIVGAWFEGAGWTEEEIKELANKRAEARKLLLSDKDYQKINADLDDERLKQKDLQEILSHYLVSYYNETKKTEVDDGSGETRQLLLSAKLGKPTAS